MGQNVIRIKFRNALGHRDGLIQAVQILKTACHPVHGFGENWISRKRLLILRQRTLLLSLGNQVQRCIVVIFSLLTLVFVGQWRFLGRRLDSSITLRATTKVMYSGGFMRSEEHTSELQSHSFISYAVFC